MMTMRYVAKEYRGPFIFPLLVYFCVVLCFLCGLCPRVESLFVVVACDHGIGISRDESIGREFGCIGWLSGKKDRFNVTIIQNKIKYIQEVFTNSRLY